MSIWKWVGAAAGGAVGFVVGGPAGAAAGAGLGYQAGASADESNAADDAKDANNAALSGIHVAPNAWTPAGGSLGSPAEPSEETKHVADMLAQLKQSLSDLGEKAKTADPATQQNVIIPQVKGLQAVIAGYEKKLGELQAKDAAAQKTQADAIFAAQEMKQSQGTAAPTIDPTKIQTTTANFGDANATLAGQKDIRQRQLDQAAGLESGAGGEGQAALIDRLNGDLSGNQPSLAQLQLEAGRDASVENAMSIANSARGNSQANAQLEALRANQAAMQDTRRQAAMLRAQEYAQARGELGTALSQKRGQDLQGQNIAATELGQGRQQDLGVAGIQSQNALSQAQIDQATRIAQANMDDNTKRANLQAYFQQQGLNDQMTQYWTDKYTHFKERPEDLAIDREKTQAAIATHVADQQISQSNAQLDRQQKNDAALGQGIATAGASYLTSHPSGGVSGGTPGTPADGGGYSRYTTATGNDWNFGRNG